MDVGMEFSRRPEELAKPESLPERPPTPGPENEVFEARNLGAVASNSDTPQISIASKPTFAVTTPPVMENLIDMPLQPFQTSTVPEAQIDLVAHSSSTDDGAHPNGEAIEAAPSTNGSLPHQMNGTLHSPPASGLSQTEATTETTGMLAPSSSMPISTSSDSFALSTTNLGTQDTTTTAPLQEPLDSAPMVPNVLEQAPPSNITSVDHPTSQDFETPLQIQHDEHKQDLAHDPQSTLGTTAAGGHAMSENSTPQAAPFATEEQPAVVSDVEDSFDAFIRQAPVISDPDPTYPKSATKSTHTDLSPDQTQPTVPQSINLGESAQVQVDQPMVDAPLSAGKISREREDDGEEHGPATKRLKGEALEPGHEFKVPEAPTHSAHANQPSTDAIPPIDDTITPARLAHMKKVIANLKKSAISKYFREAVDIVKLNIPNYPDVIKHPMDLGTLDRKLKSSTYNTMSEFFADFNLIVNNSINFNGMRHEVSMTGIKMRQSFQNQMKALPPPEFKLPAKEEKKISKAKEHTVRTASQRRPSIPQASVESTPRSPATPAAATTFALGPEGMPLIRRDSTVGDGRPKRAIHPPKRRDHEFGPARPRKKKFEWQLKFCKEVINEMKKPKHYAFAQYFYFPVDPVALNIPSYHKVVKKPMDMDSVEKKLDTNQYEKARDFEEDVRQIFKNCYLFNTENDFVYNSGQQLEKIFEDKWATKDEWLAAHEPTSESQSAGEEDEEDEASDDEEDDSADERSDEIAQLKAQIAMMSQTIGNLTSGPKKKKKTTPPAPALGKKSGKSKKKDKPSSFPGLQQTAKDKKKSFSKPRPEKEHFVTYNEKQHISSGISSLPDARMSEALRIIQSNVPSLKNTHETEIELDIDELPNHVLLKLLSFVKKYGQPAQTEPEPAQQPAYAPPIPTPSKPKKNKPMSKQEQEQQIRELKGRLGVYDGSQTSPGPIRSVENAVDSSGDDDSEESEEE